MPGYDAEALLQIDWTDARTVLREGRRYDADTRTVERPLTMLVPFALPSEHRIDERLDHRARTDAVLGTRTTVS